MSYILLMLLFFFQQCYAGINVKKPTSTIEVSDGAGLVVEGQITNYGGELIKDNGGEVSGNNIEFNGGTFNDSGNSIKLTGNLNLGDGGGVLLDGGKTFKGKRGDLLNSLRVRGKNNRLEGIIQMSDDIILENSESSLTCALQGSVPCNVVLNGGELFLEEDFNFVDDAFFTGSGIIKLNSRKLRLGATNFETNASLYFDQGQDIECAASLGLHSGWTFSGDSKLDGNGKIICLKNGGEIIVERGSSFLLEDVVIMGVAGNNIRCLDSKSTLSLRNVTLVQDSDFSFTVGAIHFLQDCHVRGTHVFAYQSAQTSTVFSRSELIFDKGTTFSFDPIWNESFDSNSWRKAREFLAFEDSSSVLLLKGATLHITTTSMKLKNGTLRVKNGSYINSEIDENSISEQGLIIGNNSSNEDMICEIANGADLRIVNGALSYKNVGSSSFNMFGRFSHLSIGEGSSLNMYQPINLGEGSISFYEGSTLAKTNGAEIIGSVHMLGSVYYGNCSS